MSRWPITLCRKGLRGERVRAGLGYKPDMYGRYVAPADYTHMDVCTCRILDRLGKTAMVWIRDSVHVGMPHPQIPGVPPPTPNSVQDVSSGRRADPASALVVTGKSARRLSILFRNRVSSQGFERARASKRVCGESDWSVCQSLADVPTDPTDATQPRRALPGSFFPAPRCTAMISLS